MGDEHHRNAEAPLHVEQVSAQAQAQNRIERRKRFIEEQDTRSRRKRSGECRALPLSAGELRGIAQANIGQRKDLEKVVDRASLRRDQGPRVPARQRCSHVVLHGAVRKQRIVLEDVADIAPARWYVDIARPIEPGFAIDDDPSTVGAHEAREHLQRQRLARAGRTEQCEPFRVGAKLHGEVEPAALRDDALGDIDVEAHSVR